jgi:hypothetical protein
VAPSRKHRSRKVLASLPEWRCGHIFSIIHAVFLQPQAHGLTGRRPHALALMCPDGIGLAVGRSSNLGDMQPGDLASPRAVEVCLDKEGFFSERWIKPVTSSDLLDSHKATDCGELPEPHRSEFERWYDCL